MAEVSTPVQGAGVAGAAAAALASSGAAGVDAVAGGAVVVGKFTRAQPANKTNATNPMIDHRFICALLVRIGYTRPIRQGSEFVGMNVVMATTITEEVYTIEEVAAIFRVPVDTIRRLIQRGQLPALRLGRVYRVPKRVVAQLLEQPATSYAPEDFGFGSWKTDTQTSDSVDYVNLLRDAAPRSLSEYVADLSASTSDIN